MNYDLGISYFLSQITHASCVGGTSLLYESNNVIYISVWDVHLIFSFPIANKFGHQSMVGKEPVFSMLASDGWDRC